MLEQIFNDFGIKDNIIDISKELEIELSEKQIEKIIILFFQELFLDSRNEDLIEDIIKQFKDKKDN